MDLKSENFLAQFLLHREYALRLSWPCEPLLYHNWLANGQDIWRRCNICSRIYNHQELLVIQDLFAYMFLRGQVNREFSEILGRGLLCAL